MSVAKWQYSAEPGFGAIPGSRFKECEVPYPSISSDNEKAEVKSSDELFKEDSEDEVRSRVLGKVVR